MSRFLSRDLNAVKKERGNLGIYNQGKEKNCNIEKEKGELNYPKFFFEKTIEKDF